MKIGIIGQKGIVSVSGGVETYVEGLAVGLAKKGHDVYVYSRKEYAKNTKKYKGVKIIALPSIKTKNLEAISHTFLACLDIVFRRNFDIVNFQAIGPSSLIWIVRLLKPRTKVVSSLRCKCYNHDKWSSFAKMYLKFGEFACSKFSNQTISSSKLLKKYAKDKYNADSIYIPNAVEPKKNIKADTIKKKFGLKKNSYILVVSRLVAHKRIDSLITAFNHIRTDKKLVIVGEGAYTDDYVELLKNMSRNNKNIIFTGFQKGKTLSELYSNAFLLVQPTESEGMSNVLLEAMAYNCNILMSDIPENLEVAGGIAHTFKVGSTKSLKNKLRNIINNKLISNKKLAKNKLKQEYNWNVVVNSIENVYLEVLNKKNNLIRVK